ncbi:M20 family metallopeptidase [Rhabdothermincola sediminis]|uniref:M20 family metallopeptidase n=1 Tax=Rhabdothermincola sediminis TaxID=2751370 RepID=UPI001AA0ACE8|nr:M20 family metallopeptidase [Rhabdothermincola sediminis]
MPPTDLDAVKDRLCQEVDERADLLVDVARQIHANPELAFRERFAHDLLTGILAAEGLDTECHAYGLDTAFAARAGSAGPTVAVLCEYDALPGIGHACGHNVIAAAGLGAGLAVAAMAGELGGRVAVLGTPAEEGGGGKVRMARRGALDGVDAAMMVHPAGADLRRMDVIAIQQLWVEYHGEAAHAAAFPHKGRNALDAAVLGYMNVAALRQHIRPEERVHGIFTEAGDKPNIVPAHTAAQWYVRAATMKRLHALAERVHACLQAGADAAGCRMEAEWKDPPYADMVDNEPLLDLYAANAERLGRHLRDPDEFDLRVVGSTDMGNVSHLVPSIHPMIAVAPPHVGIHTPEFAEYTASEGADRAVLDAAKAMAMTVADLWLLPEALQAVRDAFAEAGGGVDPASGPGR